MARIRYTGNLEHRIPGVGPIGPEWITVADSVAAEHDSSDDKAAGWDVEREKTDSEATRGQGDMGKGPKLETQNSELKTVAPGGDA